MYRTVDPLMKQFFNGIYQIFIFNISLQKKAALHHLELMVFRY